MVARSPPSQDTILIGAGFDTWAGAPFVQARLALLGKTVFLLAFGAAIGCASQQYVEIGTIAAEVRADEVSATVKYRDKIVGLRGRVIKKGVKSARVMKTEGVRWSASTYSVNKNSGYLVLRSDSVSLAEAICLFEPGMMENLAPVKEGQSLKLRCVFSMIVGEHGARTPVFYGCTVDP